MALNWFKKKKHKQEEKTSSEQKINEASEALETEAVADIQPSGNHDDHEHEKLENESPPPFNANDQDVECLHESDLDLDVSVLLSSICDDNDVSESCLLHWGRSAAKITEGGSYIMLDVAPEKYDLEIILISSGIVLKVHVINVEPVQAGGAVLYDFVTK